VRIIQHFNEVGPPHFSQVVVAGIIGVVSLFQPVPTVQTSADAMEEHFSVLLELFLGRRL
jgi:hypothetical protein